MQAQTARCIGSEDIRAFMRERGFAPADTAIEVGALRDLAQRLIPSEIASAAVLARVQGRTGHSLFLKWDRGLPTAFLACFPLTALGEHAIRSGGFNGLRIGREWISPFCASTRAGYIWGLGGVTSSASFAVMRALRIMRERMFPHIALYARATTAGGRKLMEGFGYLPFGARDPNVLVAPALNASPLARAS
jgi:hypothetical protein